jgi:GNAT superfamily N-acetyltransferase
MSKPTNEFAKNVKFEPLTSKSWTLFEKLMGERGGCGGCWCMAYRLPTKEFHVNKFEGNKKLMKKIVAANQPTGLIATCDGEPIGWVALAPREDFCKIETARTLKRIDHKPVWSIPCFFVRKEYRKQGLSKLLIKGAIGYAKKHKIKTLEAYPVIPYSEKMPDAFLWIGALSAFTSNGFKVVQKNGKRKRMVRLDLKI